MLFIVRFIQKIALLQNLKFFRARGVTMHTRIIIDSTVDVSPTLQERFVIVPLTIHFSEKEFVDGVTMTNDSFYEMLIHSDVPPTTSQPTPDAFSHAFRDSVREGCEAVAVTISAKVSGTYQSATIAASEFRENVFVVDSKSVSIGSGLLAEYALSLADAGLRAREIAGCLIQMREQIRVFGLFETLEYLKRGGRISKTTALAGGILGIKPILSIREGAIKILGKARGYRQGQRFLVREIQMAGMENQKPLLFGYTGLSEAPLHTFLQSNACLWGGRPNPERIVQIGSVIGTHAGPGAIAVAFFIGSGN